VSREATKWTRREFLIAGGATLAGIALAEGAKGGTTSMNKTRKIRIGVVGGNFGTQFYWNEHRNCIVQAVSDLRPERRQRLQEVYKCDKAYESLEMLILDKDIEAVAVFTGAPDHVRHCIAALKAGKHVICAVPAALTIDEAEELLETVQKTGLTYMMAETSYYRQGGISARQFHQQGKFGEIFYAEAEYHHAGLEELFFENGKPTWRHGLPPMLYPTHCTSFLVGTTGERLTEVSCLGWGDDSDLLKGNPYRNPFWNETAMFQTNQSHPFRVSVFWKGAHRGCERAQWYGDRMSFFLEHPNGLGPVIVRSANRIEIDDGGFERQASAFEQYKQPNWWQTSMLPEPMRHDSGHGGSHTFIAHEFIDALVNERKPAVDIYEALAYTVPGIVGHKSALRDGERMKIPVYSPKG